MNSRSVFFVRRALFHSSAITQASARVPLIKFIGKRSLVPVQAHKATAVAPPKMAPAIKSSGFAVELPTTFGRPQLTAEEIEHIESGGASKIF